MLVSNVCIGVIQTGKVLTLTEYYLVGFCRIKLINS